MRVFKWPTEKALPEEFLAEMGPIAESGGVLVYPTSTLYGLGASIWSPQGIRAVLELKCRPKGMPLTSMASPMHIKSFCRVPRAFRPYMKAHENRVTAVLPALAKAPKALVYRGTLAVRLPCSELTSSLVDCIGPITSTSANPHGQPTPPDVDSIVRLFGGRVRAYIDSGRLEGLPTTLIDFTSRRPKIIREGALSREEMESAYG